MEKSTYTPQQCLGQLPVLPLLGINTHMYIFSSKCVYLERKCVSMVWMANMCDTHIAFNLTLTWYDIVCFNSKFKSLF